MEKALNDLLTAYMAQIDSAMKISEILSEHANEDSISPDNLILGLIYRLMVPMTPKEIKDSLDNAKEIIDGEDEDEDLHEEDRLFFNSKKVSMVEKKIKTNTCNCDICSKARACLYNYSNYEPPDELSEKFSKSIKYACFTHKLKLF
jgi:hypothetical protein